MRLYKVHRWSADEAADELVRGFVIERRRIGNLLDFPFIEYHYLVPHRHRLDLVVCDVDDGGVKSVVQPADFHPHLHAQLRIKVAQRFIKQEHLRMPDDRPTHSNTLTFAAGEMFRFAVQQVRNTENFRGFVDTLFNFRFRIFAKFQPERHVLCHRHVWIEGVVLEDHGNISVFRRDVVDAFVVDVDVAFSYLFQSGNHP